MTEKIKLGIISGVTTVALAGAPALALTSNDNGDDNPHNDVTLCHATGSQSNPYVQITVNANGAVSGHAGNQHQDGRDIIPSFEYNDNGSTKSFVGQNWDAQGQAVYNNDCQAGGKGGGTTETKATTQVATTTPAGGQGQAAAQVKQTPQAVAAQGGVNAGEGGGGETTNAGAVIGLLGSIGAIVAGGTRFVLTKKLF